MTDSEFFNWLKEGGKVVTLVEVATDTPHYLASAAYATLPTDAPANLVYTPVVAGGVSFSESVPLDGKASLSVGDIEVHNEDGRFDTWLAEIWTNRAIKVLVGDIRWPRSDFVTVFNGVVAELTCRASGRLNISIRDKLERLNTPMTDAVIGGTGDNNDRGLPCLVGEAHNVSPLLYDVATHTYTICDGPIEDIIEVRDNGVPVSVTKSLSTGRFSLIASPAGTITASVQGKTPYNNTVAGCIKQLVTTYGTPSQRFTVSDIDLDNFSSFDAAHTQPVGIYTSERSNVLAVAQDLADSLGASIVMSRGGKLRLIQLDAPSGASSITISEADYEEGSFELSRRSEVIAGVRLNFCKNYTVQTSLETGIPAQHKELFAQEWLSVFERDSTTATSYRLYAEPVAKDTHLLKKTDAQAEALRRLSLWKTQRNVFSFKGFAHLLTLEIGQKVLLKSNRYGLSDGKLGIVVGLKSDWISRRVDVEVFV